MTISLNSLRIYAYHGALPQERTVGGDYMVDLSVELPFSPTACQDDKLEGTINYATLYDIVAREMRQPANLLEHLAWRIGHAVRGAFPQIESATVKVTKVNPPLGATCNGASVEITLCPEPLQ